MKKKTDFRPFNLKKTKNIDKINQQYNLLIVCVLNMLNPNNVEWLLNLYTGHKNDR